LFSLTQLTLFLSDPDSPPAKLSGVTVERLEITFSQHLSDLFARKRLFRAALCVPSFVSAIENAVSQFEIFGWLDPLGGGFSVINSPFLSLLRR
jgi:hypothetical protein